MKAVFVLVIRQFKVLKGLNKNMKLSSVYNSYFFSKKSTTTKIKISFSKLGKGKKVLIYQMYCIIFMHSSVTVIIH